ncbi:MAG: antitoxin [Coleofasciculaceae cyanobacterium SM2_1_6]|nr:antitoxin [Coleofasciculaceae cyanobacterium SM2_1_6]
MKDEYDFTKSVQNPYSKKLKQKVSIQIEQGIVDYFEDLAKETGLSSQSLINLYLQKCVKSQGKVSID